MEYSISNGILDAKVAKNGQLVSLSLDDIEWIHGGGRDLEYQNKEDTKGWKSSNVMCFPVFGPVNENTIEVKGKRFSMNQHGILRALEKEISVSDNSISTRTKHDGKSNVRNLKYNDNLPPTSQNNPCQYWPFDCEVLEKFSFGKEGELKVQHTVINKDPVVMPFMFGWHPAFKTQGSIKEGFLTLSNGKEVSLEEVIAAGNASVLLEGVDNIDYFNEQSGLGFNISSQGYNGNWVVWMPDGQEQMFCLEPVSHFPIIGRQYFDNVLFETLGSQESKTYETLIKPFIKS